MFNRESRAAKCRPVALRLCRLSRKRGRGGANSPRAVPQRAAVGTGPRVERDRCVARLITYLRLHYCKQCISLYVRSLLPFVLSCRLPIRRPSISSRRSSCSHILREREREREPFHRARKAPRSLKSSAVSQMYFKTTRNVSYLPSLPPLLPRFLRTRVCLRVLSPSSLQPRLNPCSPFLF